MDSHCSSHNLALLGSSKVRFFHDGILGKISGTHESEYLPAPWLSHTAGPSAQPWPSGYLWVWQCRLRICCGFRQACILLYCIYPQHLLDLYEHLLCRWGTIYAYERSSKMNSIWWGEICCTRSLVSLLRSVPRNLPSSGVLASKWILTTPGNVQRIAGFRTSPYGIRTHPSNKNLSYTNVSKSL